MLKYVLAALVSASIATAIPFNFAQAQPATQQDAAAKAKADKAAASAKAKEEKAKAAAEAKEAKAEQKK
jgi:hypothetical protein